MRSIRTVRTFGQHSRKSKRSYSCRLRPTMREALFLWFPVSTIGFPVAVPHRLPGKPDNPNGRSHGMLGVDGASVPDSARGTYLWNGLCEDCIEGAICEGSRTLAVYFQRLESPRLAIPSNPKEIDGMVETKRNTS